MEHKLIIFCASSFCRLTRTLGVRQRNGHPVWLLQNRTVLRGSGSLLEGPFARAWYLGERVMETAWPPEERKIPGDPPPSMLCPLELRGNCLVQASGGYGARKFILETEKTDLECIQQRLFQWRNSDILVMHGADSPISAPSRCSQGLEDSSQVKYSNSIAL